MSLATKIMLSTLEQAKVMDAEWILTKHQIIDKAQQLLQQQIEIIKETFLPLQPQLDAAILASTPKISKGEKYKQLPYIILDYPAFFSKQSSFALRTMFWWGHNYSVHLLVSGIYLLKFKEKLLNNIKQSEKEFYVCVHETAWEHDFEPDNYILANAQNIEALINEKTEFLKVALKLNLEDWNKMSQLLPEAYHKMVHLLLD